MTSQEHVEEVEEVDPPWGASSAERYLLVCHTPQILKPTNADCDIFQRHWNLDSSEAPELQRKRLLQDFLNQSELVSNLQPDTYYYNGC
jgi:hypothetical protein